VDIDIVTADEGCAVEGVVTQSGNPVANATVQLRFPGEPEAVRCQRTDANGHYALTNLPSGSTQILASLDFNPFKPSKRFTLNLSPNKTAHQDFELDAPGTVSGVVAGASNDAMSKVLLTAPDAPFPGTVNRATFSAFVQEHSLALAEPASDGSFQIKDVSAGDYMVIAVLFAVADRDSVPDPFVGIRVDHVPVHVGDGPVTVNLSPR
jgi:hypothetical protein